MAERCPDAVRCADPFHVVRWATDALDEVRREAWNDARRGPAAATRGAGGRRGVAARPPATPAAQARPLRAVEEPREPHRQTARQARLDRQDRPPALPRLPAQRGSAADLPARQPTRPPKPSTAWVSWARRCRIPSFVELQKTIVEHTPSILAAIEHGLSNGRIESVNTKIRLITRIAFGFHVPRSPHRPGHAQPRRPPTHASRPAMTHGSVRRAHNLGGLVEAYVDGELSLPSHRSSSRAPGLLDDVPGSCVAELRNRRASATVM